MIHTRHIGIFDASHTHVTLVGAGGIGAMAALTLAKMGVSDLTIYDGDTVSPENLPTQFHRLDDLGRNKVDGLAETIRMFSDDTEVFPCAGRVTADMALYGTVVISAVDSIQARKDIWEAVKNGTCGWYLDARMAAEEVHLFTVNMDHPEWYEEALAKEDDSRVPDLTCTAKATMFCSALSAAIIGRTVRKIITGIIPPRYYVQNLITDFVLSIPGGDNATR